MSVWDKAYFYWVLYTHAVWWVYSLYQCIYWTPWLPCLSCPSRKQNCSKTSIICNVACQFFFLLSEQIWSLKTQTSKTLNLCSFRHSHKHWTFLSTTSQFTRYQDTSGNRKCWLWTWTHTSNQYFLFAVLTPEYFPSYTCVWDSVYLLVLLTKWHTFNVRLLFWHFSDVLLSWIWAASKNTWNFYIWVWNILIHSSVHGISNMRNSGER